MVSNSRTAISRKDALEREYGELMDIKALIENELFQKYFATPLHAVDKKLKDAYDCQTLSELKLTQGKHWGLQQFFKCVDEIESRLKFIKHDLDKLD